ncbi:alpha/beta fold hydrolase [Pigmentibacter ruber]
MLKFVFPSIAIFFLLSCGKKNNSDYNKSSKPTEQMKNESFWSESIVWGQCPPVSKEQNDQSNTEEHANLIASIQFECGTFPVPIDWNNPNGETINLALKKANSPNQSNKIGYLIFNPGGPGGSGVSVLESVLKLNPKLIQNFDVIGFDPRGIHASAGIKCKDSLDSDVFSFFDSEQNFGHMQTKIKNIRESCLEHSGELIDFVNTENVVKDLEAMRVALGNQKLNYLGISYGTSIGATYAYRYPHNTRVMVLDGVLDLSKPFLETVKAETIAVKTTFQQFSEICFNSANCGLNFEKISSILQNLKDEYDVRSDSNVIKITKANLLSYLSYAVTNAENWELMANAFRKLENPVQKEIELPISRDFSGFIQTFAVHCLDYPVNNLTWNEYVKLKEASKKIFPELNGHIISLNIHAICSAWQGKRHDPLIENHSLNISQPILFVSSPYDAITPHSNAILKHQQIKGSKLLEALVFKHGASLLPNATCVQDNVNKFLTTVSLPTDYLFCTGK